MDPSVTVGALWALFLGSHLVLSHPPVREPLRARLGPNVFAGAYSALALALFVPMAWTWWEHRGEGAQLWALRSAATIRVAETLIVAGFALTCGALARPGPSSVAAAFLGVDLRVKGMGVFTRHPVFMGLALLAVGHLLVNGRAVDVAFWGGFPVMTVVGGLHQDWRKKREIAGYDAYVKDTTFLPVPRLRNPGTRALAGGAVGAALALGVRHFHAAWFAG